MRQLLRLLTVCALAGLFILGLSTLVVGPENTAEAQAAPCLPDCPTALLAPAREAPASPEGAAEVNRSAPEKAAPSARTEETQTLSGPVADGNGVPLGSRSYFRAAYRAFPPEKWAG